MVTKKKLRELPKCSRGYLFAGNHREKEGDYQVTCCLSPDKSCYEIFYDGNNWDIGLIKFLLLYSNEFGMSDVGLPFRIVFENVIEAVLFQIISRRLGIIFKEERAYIIWRSSWATIYYHYD